MKKTVLFLVALATLCFAGQVQAQAVAPATAPAKPATAQQSRMSICAKQYHEQTIAKTEYHHFMSQCLRKHPLPAKPGTGAAKQ